MSNYRSAGRRVIQVRVKPNSRTSELIEEPDGTWTGRVKAPPVDGKANKELTQLIADHFDVPKSRVSIRSGAGGRMKLVEIEEG